jgi:trehalose-phosphatase
MISCADSLIQERLAAAGRLWLFLDYDGTLADFAATPDEIVPDKELIALIEDLARHVDMRVTIVSGRRLAHIQSLLPVEGILKAGSYGLELEDPNGATLNRVDYESVRPLLAQIKSEWANLLAGREGFYLEDKGWTVAIHAKDAAAEEASVVLRAANQRAGDLLTEARQQQLGLQDGHRFLECTPRQIDKKRTVEYILDTYSWHEDALPIYLGDDDKDEIAFEAIQNAGGLVVAVGDRLVDSEADCWLSSPAEVRAWLRVLLERRLAA